MSYDADLLDQAAIAPESRARALIRIVAARLRGGWTPYEQELISRLTVLAALAIELGAERHVDPVIAVAVWAEESGGYVMVRRLNANGSNDLGPLQENSVHGRSDRQRLSRIDSIAFWRDVLAARRVARGDHPLADYNAFTSGRYLSKMRFATEAVRRARAAHPTSWP